MAPTEETVITADNAPEYEKCADCHLFVDDNPSHEPGDGLAPYVHLMGGCDFCVATDETHEARPGGGSHSLAWWKEHGPALMRIRFDS